MNGSDPLATWQYLLHPRDHSPLSIPGRSFCTEIFLRSNVDVSANSFVNASLDFWISIAMILLAPNARAASQHKTRQDLPPKYNNGVIKG
jgi:hypothetical protein